MYEKQIMDAFEGIKCSEKTMDDLNEQEVTSARKIIKEIRESKDTFLNGWVTTELKRYGRLTKHDLLRIIVHVRLRDLVEILKEMEKEKKDEKCAN